MKNRLTVSQAAERLGVTVRRVQAMIRAGRLRAEKFGPMYVITESDLQHVIERRPGRPRKETNGK